MENQENRFLKLAAKLENPLFPELCARKYNLKKKYTAMPSMSLKVWLSSHKLRS